MRAKKDGTVTFLYRDTNENVVDYFYKHNNFNASLTTPSLPNLFLIMGLEKANFVSDKNRK